MDNTPWYHRFTNNPFYTPLRVANVDQLLDVDVDSRPEMRRYNPKPDQDPRPAVEAEMQLKQAQVLVDKYDYALLLMSHYVLEAGRAK